MNVFPILGCLIISNSIVFLKSASSLSKASFDTRLIGGPALREANLARMNFLVATLVSKLMLISFHKTHYCCTRKGPTPLRISAALVLARFFLFKGKSSLPQHPSREDIDTHYGIQVQSSMVQYFSLPSFPLGIPISISFSLVVLWLVFL